MKKRILCTLLAISVLLGGCAAGASQTVETTVAAPTAGETTATTVPEETNTAPVEIPVPETVTERHYGVVMPYETVPKVKGVTITPYTPRRPKTVNGVKPYGDYWYHAIVSEDLTGATELAYSLTVSDKTAFTGGVPDGYDQAALLRWGMSPGLNVDILHRFGFTGKGAVIAYIDQPAAMHPEYEGENLHYTNLSDMDNSMHGPSVLSLLMGKNIGTAPEAEVYFYGHSAWKADQTTHAEALYAIIEQNKLLPEGEKITMVGFSDNIDSSEANASAFRKAVKACEESGVMVFFCADYDSAAFIPMSDRNNYQNVIPDNWTSGKGLLVPAAGRTTVCTEGGGDYIYWASGGLSWTMPYMLGLYAIATEIDPSLDKGDLLRLADKTAYKEDGRRIVNPVGFIAQVLMAVGRTEEAEELLEAASYNRRYTYAVMNKSKMSDADIRAVETYFARMTDTTILVVDVKNGVSVQELYKALQADAWSRDGIVEGVQIFGTPDMVPAFRPKYRVQMVNGVDEMGIMESDLFYGNFLNEASQLKGYNVMDHFAEGWDVTLTPYWPVARLPLQKGEYSGFFTKYHSFARETQFERPELVNFSNPIFAQTVHTDDMGMFLQRTEREFGILDVPYRLYGNQDGEFPVTGPVLGGFIPENLALENERTVCEFIINSHGQRNNIDQTIFVNGKETRISFLNTKTIGTVLGGNPYYLDCWTCNNGEGMKDNLTTAALNGQCVGVFSATHIISNNGVNCSASLDDMGKSNFYYFYLNYLVALHQGATRSQAFWFAQKAYAEVLMADSENDLRMEGNYQFNLCNLLVYHNFGVLEPKRTGEQVPLLGYDPNVVAVEETLAVPPGGSVLENTLGEKQLEIHSISVTKTEDGRYQYQIEYTADKGMSVFAFSPPNGEIFGIHGPSGDGFKQVFSFTLSLDQIERAEAVMLSFYYSDSCRAFVRVSSLEYFME